MRRCIVAVLLLALLGPPGRCDDRAPDKGAPIKVGRLTVDPGGHTGGIQRMTFTPDGKRFVSGSKDDLTIQVWSTETGERLQILHLLTVLRDEEQDGQIAFSLSPDGRTLALALTAPGAAVSASVRLIDLAGGKPRSLKVPRAAVRELAFSRDGKRLGGVLVNDNTPALWDIANLTAAPWYLTGHEKPVNDLDFTPDGRRLATASADETVRVWDLQERKQIRSLPHGAPVTQVAWAPDGRRLASAGGGLVHTWKPAGREPAATFRLKDLGPMSRAADPKAHRIGNLAFDGKGERLLVAWAVTPGAAPGGFGVTVLEPGGNGREVFTIPWRIAYPPPIPALSLDGRWNASQHGGQIFLRANTGGPSRILGKYPGRVPFRVGWAKDNRTLAWGAAAADEDAPARLDHSLDLGTLELRAHAEPLTGLTTARHELRGWTVKENKNEFTVTRPNGTVAVRLKSRSCTLVPVGRTGVRLLASGVKGGLLVQTPPGQADVAPLERERGDLRDVAVSPNNKLVLTVTVNNMLDVYSLEKRKLLLSVYIRGDDWIAMAPEGYYAASPGGERMMGWVVPGRGGALPSFIPATQMRQQLRRPDVIARLLDTEDVGEALAQANRAAKRKADAIADISALLPPEVRLEVTAGSKLPARVTVRATAEARSDGQPVETLELRLDGRPAPLADAMKKFGPPVGRGKAAIAEWTLPLPPGSHRLTVHARSTTSVAVSEGPEVQGPSAAPDALGLLHTVCVGVSQYANDGKGEANKGLNLKDAASDARLMDAVLRERCATTLFRPGQATLLTDRHATRDGVLASLAALKDRVAPEDLVVVHLSCHGEKDDQGHLWLLTHEADRDRLTETCLSGEKLKDVLGELTCRVFLILDACHSGAVGRPRSSVSSDLTALMTDEGGVYVLTAARGREFALEQVRNKKSGQVIEHGLCTWALREALEDPKLVDPYDGRVYAHDIYPYVAREVRYHSDGKQTPYLGTPFGSRPLALLWRGTVSPGDRK